MILPGKSGISVIGTLRGTELAAPNSLVPKTLNTSGCRRVSFTDLDRNGHMNNTRYLDWVDDLLPADFHRGHTAQEFIICYHTEALEGQQLTLDWKLTDGGCLQVDAHREKTDVPGKQDRVFSAQVLFA